MSESEISTTEGFETGRLAASLSAALFEEQPPTLTLGRYRVLDVLGSGGMGVVYRAYEPELDRVVALKIVRPRKGKTDDVRLSRFVREGRVMARLRHPHIVTVYEAGTEAGVGYLAMEFLDGGTLADWARQHPVGEPGRLDALLDFALAAVEGLSAAHDERIVHRDIKPENLLLDAEGRLKVADFGVARTEGVGPPPELTASDEPSAETAELTGTDELVGTPRYAAPEQFAGKATEASDQFSLCLSLYELATGQYPFETPFAAGLEPGELLPSHGLPRWFVAALSRGLAREPGDRHGHVRDLARAIERARAPTRIRALAVGGAALAVGAILWARSGPEPCTPPEPRWWTAADHARIGEAFMDTGLAYASTASARVVQELDHYAQAWSDASAGVCVASQRGEPGTSAMTTCLARRERSATALIQRLAAPSPDAVGSAAGAVQRLPSIASCLDSAVAEGFDPPPAADVDTVEGIREAIADAVALRETGHVLQSQEASERAVERARASGYPPVLAEALVELGEVHFKRSARDEARTVAKEALVVARGVRHRAMSARAATLLLWSDAEASAELWAELAMAEAEAVPRANFEREVSSLLAERLASAGKLTEALTIYEQLLSSAADDGALAVAAVNAASIHLRREEHDRAAELAGHALEAFSQTFGDKHPSTLTARFKLAVAYWGQGELTQARDAFESVLAARSEVLGDDAGSTLEARYNLALVYTELSAFDKARALMEQLATQYPAGSLDQAQVEVERAGIELMAGDLDRARDLTHTGMSALRAATDSRMILGQGALAASGILQAAGDVDGARAELAHARAQAEVFDPADPWHAELARMEAALENGAVKAGPR